MSEHLLCHKLNINIICFVVILLHLDEQHGRGETLGRQGVRHDEPLGFEQVRQGCTVCDDFEQGSGCGDGQRARLEVCKGHLAAHLFVRACS